MCRGYRVFYFCMKYISGLDSEWEKIFNFEFQKPYFQALKKFLVEEIESKKILYPHPDDIFRAFCTTPFSDVSVVILGQDPYHGPHQAHGLSFSVPEGIKIPPSLQNIFKEIEADSGKTIPLNGNLDRWAKQGVLLLNATLTVEAGKAGSHQNKGWEIFTDTVIQTLSQKSSGIVFLLWGSFAQKKQAMIDHTKHCVLTAPHPSPLSAYRGFFGCRHFSQTNEYLHQQGKKQIDW